VQWQQGFFRTDNIEVGVMPEISSGRVVALIGRPNVGKSTLFNRIIGEQRAIVHDVSGVTRDRHYAEAEWSGKSFTVIDTGGFVPRSSTLIERAVREQTAMAIEEADKVVFLVDAREGPTPLDFDIAQVIRKYDRRVILAANKVDSENAEASAAEFFRLGLGTPFPISALTGRNIGDFLDLLVKDFQGDGKEEAVEPRTKIAIVGRPNVGKSSLVNSLLGKPRAIVTEIPGTTRDSIDSVLHHRGEEFILIDTAGLRKRSAVKESIEFFGTIRTLRSIGRCDVAVALIDASLGLEKQDLRIIGSVAERKKGIVIAVNKWDLVEKDSRTAQEYERAMKRRLRMFNYAPILFVSAKTKQRIFDIVELCKRIRSEREKTIETHTLNQVLLKEIERTPPSSPTGKEIKIKYVTQVKAAPPVFAFFANDPKSIPSEYRRFLENKLRKHFGFDGVPISIVFKQK